MRTVTCTNGEYSITFGETSFSPFLLAHIDGIYETDNNLIISKNAMSDGGTFQGTSSNIRNIVLTVMVEPNHVWRQDSRDILYKLFSKDSFGTLTYEENSNRRNIKYRVESIKQSPWKKRTFDISLLCEDPYFYASEANHLYLANYVGQFEFIHEFVAEGEEFGSRSEKKISVIDNTTGIDGIGMTITIACLDEVINPSVIKIETGERLILGVSSRPLKLVRGDILTITTSTNDKHVYLNHNNVVSEINQYISEEAEFIQLSKGINNIGYTAESGEDNMQLEISYLLKYGGA